MKAKKTILCVDDNEQSLAIRKIMLETRGYKVIACTSGRAALEAFARSKVDLVLTDLVMPELPGDKLTAAIKDLSPHTPVIIFSGKIKPNEGTTRADLFIAKGMNAPTELLEQIQQLIDKKLR